MCILIVWREMQKRYFNEQEENLYHLYSASVLEEAVFSLLFFG